MSRKVQVRFLGDKGGATRLCYPTKTTTQRTICYLKTEKEKRYNEQPTHKTAHLQAPTHKPMLQLAKEQFSCRRTAE